MDISKIKQSVVSIGVKKAVGPELAGPDPRKFAIIGSGFLVRPNIVLTCHHVLLRAGVDAERRMKPPDNIEIHAMRIDEKNRHVGHIFRLHECSFAVCQAARGGPGFAYDIAIIELNLPPQDRESFSRSFAPLHIVGGNERIADGEELVVAGFTYGNQGLYLEAVGPQSDSRTCMWTDSIRRPYPLAHFGHVAAIDPPEALAVSRYRAIVADVTAAAGGSGAPVCDLQGRVFGVLVGGVQEELRGPANSERYVPLGSAFVQPLWEELVKRIVQLLPSRAKARKS